MNNKNTPSEKKEEQLSITFDGFSENQGILPTKEFLETREVLQKQDSEAKVEKVAEKAAEKIAEKTVAENARVNTGTKNKVTKRAHLPQNPIIVQEEPPKPLSDMEVMEHTATVWHYKEIVNDGTEMHTEFHQKHS